MSVLFAVPLGLIFGSFASAVSYRIPRNESFTRGRSKCPSCGAQISAVHNVPLFGYALLGGRCAACKERISVRYPVIEASTGALFGLAAYRFGLTVEGAAYAAFFWALVVLTVIDLDFKLLPDKVTLPLFVVGVAALALASTVAGGRDDWPPPALLGAGLALMVGGLSWEWPPWKVFSRPVSIADEEPPEATRSSESAERSEGPAPSDGPAPVSDVVFLALGASGALLWIVLLALAFVEGELSGLPGAAVGSAMFSALLFVMNMFVPRGIGMGDAKLALSLGLFLGYLGAPKFVLVAMFMSFLLGGVGGILLLVAGAGRKDQVPFGPYLVAGTLLAIFGGDWLAGIYIGSF